MGAATTGPADRCAVRTTGLTVRRGRHDVLHGVSVRVPTSGVTVVGGPNGAGKSTLLECLATLREPDAGEIELLGRRLDNRTDRSWIRTQIGYLPQEPSAPAGFTVDDLYHYCAWLARIDDRSLERALGGARARAELDVPGNRKLKRLSGGQRRRAFVAATAIADPPLLVLDEPTAGLDVAYRIDLRTQLRRLAVGRAVVVASHITEDFESLADRVLILSAGQVSFAGDRGDFLSLARPDTDRRAGAAAPVPTRGAERALLAASDEPVGADTPDGPTGPRPDPGFLR